jgi:hypothetical protein
MRIPEHTVVETIKHIYHEDSLLPLHSVGTIVHVYHPQGYEVEFLLKKAEFEEETGINSSESIVVTCPEDSIIARQEVH